MLSSEDHARISELHAGFLQVAGDIAHLIKQKNFMAAREALAPSGAFDQASHELCGFLHRVALHHRSKPGQKHSETDANGAGQSSPAATDKEQD